MLCKMAGITQVSSCQDAIRRTRRIQAITIVWMSVEAALSLWAAWAARSPALLAFGGDSFIELFSAIVVLWRFTAKTGGQWAERRAALVAGVLLFALAAFVTGISAITLVGRNEPQPTLLGIAILIAAAVFMPWLAQEKRRLAGVTGSVVLRADAAESAVCGYLSLIALVGLALNAIWHISWADPVAALCLLPFIVREGWKAIQGEHGCC